MRLSSATIVLGYNKLWKSYGIVLGFTKCRSVIGNSEQYNAYNKAWVQKIFRGGR